MGILNSMRLLYKTSLLIESEGRMNDTSRGCAFGCSEMTSTQYARNFSGEKKQLQDYVSFERKPFVHLEEHRFLQENISCIIHFALATDVAFGLRRLNRENRRMTVQSH